MRPRFWAVLLFWLMAAALLAPRLYRHITAGQTYIARYGIINAHEHVQAADVIPVYLRAAERAGIRRTVLAGSPEATLLTGRKGFYGHDKNNEEVLAISRKWPGKFIPFVTLDPADSAKLEKLKRYTAGGARGLKLYSGHSMFHNRRLDDPVMTGVYNFCETSGLPVLFHVNSGFYQQEFENVLKSHPRLKVICPHYCLASIRKDRFETLMTRYPNLFTDISFGFIDYLKSGLLHFSADPESMRQLIIRFQDRILFGTDTVLTRAKYKTDDWYYKMAQTYRDLLEKETYEFFGVPNMTLRGFRLEPAVLEKIYRRNFEKLIKPEPSSA